MPYSNPSSMPTYPNNLIQPQIAQISITYKEQLYLWREQNILIKALKKQLTNAIKNKHLKELEDTYTGFNNMSI